MLNLGRCPVQAAFENSKEQICVRVVGLTSNAAGSDLLACTLNGWLLRSSSRRRLGERRSRIQLSRVTKGRSAQIGFTVLRTEVVR